MTTYSKFTLDTPVYKCDRTGRVDPSPIGTLRDVFNASRFNHEIVIEDMGEFYSMRVTFVGNKREAFISSNCSMNSSYNTWKRFNEFVKSLPPLER